MYDVLYRKGQLIQDCELQEQTYTYLIGYYNEKYISQIELKNKPTKAIFTSTYKRILTFCKYSIIIIND